jgi:hypothetical protein
MPAALTSLAKICRGAAAGRLRVFSQRYRQRVRLFSGRTPEHPIPDRLGIALGLEHTAERRACERLECVAIAKETRDPNQKVIMQRASLPRSVAKDLPS